MSLTNVELNKLAKYYKINLNAVLMKDQFEHVEPLYGNYITNLQSSFQGHGTHYCAIVVHKSGIVYVDSFGAWAPTDILNFIKQFPQKYAMNAWVVQDMQSELCGWYCMGLFMYLSEHLRDDGDIFVVTNDFINLFVDNTKLNGNLLKQFYRSFKKKPNNFVTTRLFPQKIL